MTPEQHILNLYKKVGETPLESLIRFKHTHPEFQNLKMTYAGRLDPMAEGVLVVLAGNIRDEKKNKILSLDKEYEFEILWGFESDTYDVLGIVKNSGIQPEKNFDRKFPSLVQKIIAKKTQEYPPYSSRTVGGKSLFMWAREGKIDEIDIPTRQIKIFSFEHIETRREKQVEILDNVLKKISLVEGDFRQGQVNSSWQNEINRNEYALITKCRAVVSGGTYVRSLVHYLGAEMGCGALAYSIKRTRVGNYKVDTSVI